jgi:hypothetical protein
MHRRMTNKDRGKVMHTKMKTLLNKGQMIPGLGILMLVSFGMLVGCQMIAQPDMGKMVPSGNRVAIKSGGPFDEQFQTEDMTVTYKYWTASKQLKVRGTTRIRFQSIDELVFHLYWLDEQGKVIDIKNFFSFLDDSDFIKFRSSDRQFHRDFTIPAGAKAFAIGYKGDTMASQDEDQVTFSYFPFNN